MPNKTKFTPARRKALLELLKKTVPIGVACEKIGINRMTEHFNLRWSDNIFLWEDYATYKLYRGLSKEYLQNDRNIVNW
jgi:hypothetical protein